MALLPSGPTIQGDVALLDSIPLAILHVGPQIFVTNYAHVPHTPQFFRKSAIYF
jgi:hypothetical protein